MLYAYAVIVDKIQKHIHSQIFYWTLRRSERVRALLADIAVTMQQWGCLSFWTESPKRSEEGQEWIGALWGEETITPTLCSHTAFNDWTMLATSLCTTSRVVLSSAWDPHTLCNMKEHKSTVFSDTSSCISICSKHPDKKKNGNGKLTRSESQPREIIKEKSEEIGEEKSQGESQSVWFKLLKQIEPWMKGGGRGRGYKSSILH